MHGQIGLTIYISRHLLATGAVVVDKTRGVRPSLQTGVKVGPFQLPNKGSVGLAFRLHDVCLAFATAHFAADKNQRSRVEARNKVRHC